MRLMAVKKPWPRDQQQRGARFRPKRGSEATEHARLGTAISSLGVEAFKSVNCSVHVRVSTLYI